MKISGKKNHLFCYLWFILLVQQDWLVVSGFFWYFRVNCYRCSCGESDSCLAGEGVSRSSLL